MLITPATSQAALHAAAALRLADRAAANQAVLRRAVSAGNVAQRAAYGVDSGGDLEAALERLAPLEAVQVRALLFWQLE